MVGIFTKVQMLFYLEIVAKRIRPRPNLTLQSAHMCRSLCLKISDMFHGVQALKAGIWPCSVVSSSSSLTLALLSILNLWRMKETPSQNERIKALLLLPLRLPRPFVSGNQFKSPVSNHCAGYHGANSDESDGDDLSISGKKSKNVTRSQRMDTDDEDEKLGRWNSQIMWLSNVLESAMSWYKQNVRPGDTRQATKPATTRSLVDIALNLHRSTIAGMHQWSLGDLTLGLYLLSLRHATEMTPDSVKGEKVISPTVVTELIYHVELAKGAYMKDPANLARVSMLRESNVVKFMDKSSVMRPAYYIAVDVRERLVILGIRGTSSIHDLVTDLVAHSDEEVTFDGGTVHFGTAKAAEWFIANELDTLRHWLKINNGFSLRLVGHSLGGATASLLAMMLRKKSEEELGFSPNVVSAVAFASPPCVSRMLALQSVEFVRTIVLQDDIIPRMSAVSLLRLRNEIKLDLDWSSFLRKEAEERKGVLDLVASTVEALSSVQDVAQRYRAFASRFGPSNNHGTGKPSAKQLVVSNENRKHEDEASDAKKPAHHDHPVEELFSPGLLFHIRGRPVFQKSSNKFTEGMEGCTLWEAYPNEFFNRIVLSGSFFRDHKCDSYYQGLRDTLKGL